MFVALQVPQWETTQREAGRYGEAKNGEAVAGNVSSAFGCDTCRYTFFGIVL